MIKALLVSSLAILVIVMFIVAMFMVPRINKWEQVNPGLEKNANAR